MKYLKAVAIIMLTITSFSACEKDDICVEGDTPLLVIRFYDVDNPTEFKSVPSLRIVGLGKNSTVDTFTDRSSSLDSIGIPLNAGATSTTFSFIMDSANDGDGIETGNTDTLTFSYEIEEKYISRACGFIANYTNLSTDFAAVPENWIQNIELTTEIIENSTTAHVKIFH